MKKVLWILAGLGVLLGILYFKAFPSYGSAPMGNKNSKAPDHQIWDQLVKSHVKADGLVDYRGFQADMTQLETYLDQLSNNAPTDDWTEAEKLAYWINAYNAFTVKVIADNYPLESIRELHTVPGVATVWHEEFFEIGGQPTSLNQIEHGILRRDFVEPRIHFAINCASMSCPVLRAEAYTVDKLEAQLTEQARLFLQQEIRNQISSEQANLSSIFSWFKGDFTREGSLVDYINQYLDEKLPQDVEIQFLEYDWSINAHDLSL